MGEVSKFNFFPREVYKVWISSLLSVEWSSCHHIVPLGGTEVRTAQAQALSPGHSAPGSRSEIRCWAPQAVVLATLRHSHTERRALHCLCCQHGGLCKGLCLPRPWSMFVPHRSLQLSWVKKAVWKLFLLFSCWVVKRVRYSSCESW